MKVIKRGFLIALAVMMILSGSYTHSLARQDDPDLFEKFVSFEWIAYAPTHFDPEADPQVMPTEQDIREDLQVLYDVGFRGIVTYGSQGIFAEIPRIAREVGFEGVVMGVWMPGDEAELQGAINAADYVDGYVMGNEGLYFSRYDYKALEEAVLALREETGKPVATTEPLTSYENEPRLFQLGDWLFPNVHPYWAGITDPMQAAQWTQDRFDELVGQAGDTFVIFKEVGLPSGGEAGLNEYSQAEYYTWLKSSTVNFVYFEAFDQPWKTEGDVGPYWGLFKPDRSPKVAAQHLQTPAPFYIYADANAPYNHFVPEGWMPAECTGNIQMDEDDQSNPYAGTSAIKISFTPLGCSSGWGGIYWWAPPGNEWCLEPANLNLTKYTKVTFWARGEQGGELAEFKVGGLDCDSFGPVSTGRLQLTPEWTQYTISLYQQDLSAVSGGFIWVTNAKQNVTIYLDEIRFE